MDDFVFTLTRDEFLDIFFDELVLPNLVNASSPRSDRIQAGAGRLHANRCRPTSIWCAPCAVPPGGGWRCRTYRRAPAGRGKSWTGSKCRIAPATGNRTHRTRDRLRQGAARGDTLHRPFRSALQQPRRIPEAVDAGGHVLPDGRLRLHGRADASQMAKRFFMLPLPLSEPELRAHRGGLHPPPRRRRSEVDEDNFFHSRETGGTIVSSALKPHAQVISERLQFEPVEHLRRPGFRRRQNWNDDSPRPANSQRGSIPALRAVLFAYIEVTEGRPRISGSETRLKEIQPRPLRPATHRELVTDIYPVFRELFLAAG